MITSSLRTQNTNTPWKESLRKAIRDPNELMQILGLPKTSSSLMTALSSSFPLLVPRSYVARMRKHDPNDPLLLQVMPDARELLEIPGYSLDPVGDRHAEPLPGVLHKYHGRLLLITTGACAVHCRYCFRRHFPYAESNPARRDWQSAIDYIRCHTEIDEVILSGGDPLMLDDEKLQRLIRKLDAIDHLRRLRIHTRLPIVIPERVDDALLAWMRESRLQLIVVTHVNHPNELDDEVGNAMLLLHDAGAFLLNQSVLLRGVNDCSDVLSKLSMRLFETKVIPYYLHLLDPVRGSAHYDISEKTAKGLIRDLRQRLPGYMVPRLVCEKAGEPNKTPVLDN